MFFALYITFIYRILLIILFACNNLLNRYKSFDIVHSQMRFIYFYSTRTFHIREFPFLYSHFEIPSTCALSGHHLVQGNWLSCSSLSSMLSCLLKHRSNSQAKLCDLLWCHKPEEIYKLNHKNRYFPASRGGFYKQSEALSMA